MWYVAAVPLAHCVAALGAVVGAAVKLVLLAPPLVLGCAVGALRGPAPPAGAPAAAIVAAPAASDDALAAQFAPPTLPASAGRRVACAALVVVALGGAWWRAEHFLSGDRAIDFDGWDVPGGSPWSSRSDCSGGGPAR